MNLIVRDIHKVQISNIVPSRWKVSRKIVMGEIKVNALVTSGDPLWNASTEQIIGHIERIKIGTIRM